MIFEKNHNGVYCKTFGGVHSKNFCSYHNLTWTPPPPDGKEYVIFYTENLSKAETGVLVHLLFRYHGGVHVSEADNDYLVARHHHPRP